MAHVVQQIKQNPLRKAKTVYSLESPFRPAQWPLVAPSDQEDILDLLIDILSPIGQHRSETSVPSKGRRQKKRKRTAEGAEAEGESSSSHNGGAKLPTHTDLHKYVTIGFNSTNRCLESLAAPLANNPEDEPVGHENLWMEAVFVARAHQPPMLHGHLPLLIKAASLANPSKAPIRLISLPKAADERLNAALKLPKVGIVGLLQGAPRADILLELIRTKVSEVEVPWLEKIIAGHYLPVEIRSFETTAPLEAKRKGPRQVGIGKDDP